MKQSPAKFSELFRVKHGYAFKSEYFDSSGEFVLLTPGSFHEQGGYRDQGDKTKYYTGDVPDSYVLEEGELLVAMTEQAPGLLGSSAWIPESNRFLHNQRLGRIVELNERRIDKRFLYYLFNTAGVRGQLSGSASGTKVRHTSPERIGRVEANLPPVESQRRIASTLTAYDELMENNRRRMGLLENAARLLYQEWFVRLRFPGHEHTSITQGSGKSYSMVMFTEKVRRYVPGNFTFVIMTDREDLDDQIWRTFVGCGMVDPKTTPRASSGAELKEILKKNHSFVFTLIHKFNQPVDPREPYSERDDIIVISDEAHRTQAGRFARNMRLALPNASFIGFTGTPLFKHDHLTRRIFGGYVSRYDFKRSEEDQSTVKLVYENRGEKLGIARLDLNDRIAETIEQAGLDADQEALLENLLGQDYEIITAGDRLNKLAVDFVEHCAGRWESGKSMLVRIDKITCGRMWKRVRRLWKLKQARLAVMIPQKAAALATFTDETRRLAAEKELAWLRGQAQWMESTIIEVIISEAQNEVRDFAKWGINIIPRRVVMKNGFETPDGKRLNVEDAFKNDTHPFRVAIVCAMWLTGFDVECLQTLYIDKPLKAHTLMQAIARANRIYPGKDCGVIVDYNGMLKSLRAALAEYALGDAGNEGGEGDPAIPLEDYVPALMEAIEATEKHLRDLGFEPNRLNSATGFTRIAALRDAVDALYTTDESKRRFEIMAREVFSRMKTLILEPSVQPCYVRHDNIEAIYKKLDERRDTADVTEVLKELHKIVNEAIRAQSPGGDQAEGLTMDLSQIDFEKLRDEFAKKVKRKRAALQDIRELVEKKLADMLARNPTRMDYYKKYQAIIADYNREKDRVTVEETFGKVARLVAEMDEELQRHVREGLSEDELTLFDMLLKENISKADREKLKQASKGLLARLKEHLASMPNWTKNITTQADVQMFILDNLHASLPRPPFTDEEAEALATRLYSFVWQWSETGALTAA